MNCEVKDNLIIIKQDSLDIYDAPVLKEKIAAAASANNRTVVLDLRNVEDVSTPAIRAVWKQHLPTMTGAERRRRRQARRS